MLHTAIDYFFVVFHSLLILFNLFGWIWSLTRKANLITLLLTGFSWLFLGLFYGLGYCPLTDWHWQILIELNQPPQTDSYVAYFLLRVLGIEVTDGFADNLTLCLYLLALILSLLYNIKSRFIRRRTKRETIN